MSPFLDKVLRISLLRIAMSTCHMNGTGVGMGMGAPDTWYGKLARFHQLLPRNYSTNDTDYGILIRYSQPDFPE